jgi:hypothetical protein
MQMTDNQEYGNGHAVMRCRAELHAPYGRGQKKAALFFAL